MPVSEVSKQLDLFPLEGKSLYALYREQNKRGECIHGVSVIKPCKGYREEVQEILGERKEWK